MPSTCSRSSQSPRTSCCESRRSSPAPVASEKISTAARRGMCVVGDSGSTLAWARAAIAELLVVW
uniref:Uncharacterized protein n=1 Tax=Arundo donax TaxID=35708 RepID=A0A0A9F1V7_ARUDO